MQALIIILIVVCILALVYFTSEDRMHGLINGGLGVALIVLTTWWCVIVPSADPRDASYMRGQIDALTGTIKIKLVTKPDSSKTWEPIK